MATNEIDLRGKKFSRWTVIAPSVKYYKWQRRWQCVCECGFVVYVNQCSLLSGRSRSCGCLQREVAAEIGLRSITHGRTIVARNLEYASWNTMKQRCLNSNSREYRYYGARGITVYEPWLMFENFYSDMGPRDKGYELDRIDPNGNYEPGNCRWIPRWTGKQRSQIKLDLQNRRFGRLIAIEPRGQQRWRCNCDCGGITVVRRQALLQDQIKSCGCFRREKMVALNLVRRSKKRNRVYLD